LKIEAKLVKKQTTERIHDIMSRVKNS